MSQMCLDMFGPSCCYRRLPCESCESMLWLPGKTFQNTFQQSTLRSKSSSNISLWIGTVCFIFFKKKLIRINAWFFSKPSLSTRGYQFYMGRLWIVAKQFGFWSFAEAKVLGAGGHRLPRTRQGVSNHKGSRAPHELCGVSLWLVVLGAIALRAWVIGSVLLGDARAMAAMG